MSLPSAPRRACGCNTAAWAAPRCTRSAMLLEDGTDSARALVQKELFSMFPDTSQPHTHSPMPKATFLGCPPREVWPTTSILSLSIQTIPVSGFRLPLPASAYRGGWRYSVPSFFFCFSTTSTLFSANGCCLQIGFPSACWESCWKTSAQNIRTSNKTHREVR